MGVADVMYTDLFDPCTVANVVEGDTDGGIDQRDQPVRFFQAIGFLDVYPDLVTQKIRDWNGPDAVGSFGGGDDILPVNPVKCLCHMYDFLFQVNIRRGEGQGFTAAQSCIIEDTVQYVVGRIFYTGNQRFKFFMSPELHPLGFAAPDQAGYLAGILGKAVIFHRKIQYGVQLSVDIALSGGL